MTVRSTRRRAHVCAVRLCRRQSVCDATVAIVGARTYTSVIRSLGICIFHRRKVDMLSNVQLSGWHTVRGLAVQPQHCAETHQSLEVQHC